MAHKSPGAPFHKIRTNSFMEAVKKINEGLTKSMQKIADEMGTSSTTVHRTARTDLEMQSFARGQRHLRTARQREVRLERSKMLLTWLKNHPSMVKLFSDKKNFTVDEAFNSLNDRYPTNKHENISPIMRTKHPASLMILGAIASNGKEMPLHFFSIGLRGWGQGVPGGAGDCNQAVDRG